MKIKRFFKKEEEISEDSVLYLKAGVTQEGLTQGTPYTIEVLGDTLVVLKELPDVYYDKEDFQLVQPKGIPSKISKTNMERLFKYISFKKDGKSSRITPNQIERITETHIEGKFNTSGFSNKEYRTRIPLNCCEIVYNKGSILNGDRGIVPSQLLNNYKDKKGNIVITDPKTGERVSHNVDTMTQGEIYTPVSVTRVIRSRSEIQVTFPGGMKLWIRPQDLFINFPRKVKRPIQVKDNVLVRDKNATGVIKELIKTSCRTYYRIELDTGSEMTTEKTNLKLIK